MIRLVVPLPIPSSNLWTFKNRWAYLKHRDQWYTALDQAAANVKPPAFDGPFHASCCVFAYRQRLLDEANLIGGFKPGPDWMKHNGFIYDDDPRHYKGLFFQLKCRKKADQKTVICLAYQELG